jgi:hypothetical protein
MHHEPGTEERRQLRGRDAFGAGAAGGVLVRVLLLEDREDPERREEHAEHDVHPVAGVATAVECARDQ